MMDKVPKLNNPEYNLFLFFSLYFVHFKKYVTLEILYKNILNNFWPLYFVLSYIFKQSRGSSVDTATDYVLEKRVIRIRLPARGRCLCLVHSILINSGSQSHSYPLGTGCCVQGVKRPGRDADHYPPSCTDVNNAWTYTSITPYYFNTWCLIN
jgi:hypothetical protein